jgi:DMSO/TMAO reductase YedYZ heme-binding membrane subunit/uncharacterized protein with FMN-binding domain
MNKLISLSNRLLWILISLVAILVVVRNFVPSFLEDYRSWNALPAHIATYLFLATVLPGVLQRIGFAHSLLRLLIAWRRTIGIAMYFFALVHMFFLLGDLPWFSGGAITALDALTATGLFAMIVLLPALLTSNTSSIRFFKRYWKIIQRSTYISIPLIALHLYESGETIPAFAYVVVAALIILSFVVAALRGKTLHMQLASKVFATILLATGISYATWATYIRRDVPITITNVPTQRSETDQLDQTGLVFSTTSDTPSDSLEQEVDTVIAQESDEVIELEPETIYANGLYSANGEYATDRGKLIESLDVTVTIEDDQVSAMDIIGNITNNKSQRYHDRFDSAIDSMVIGKDLADIDVDAVGGASDTTDGFMLAIESIQKQALR